MEGIRERCGREIEEAVGGDRARAALLAAITANESGGDRQLYRFGPANYERLAGLLRDAESSVDGVTRAQLEKRLSAAGPDPARTAMLKKLAGLHGYTQLAGYHCILSKAPLEALTEKGRHFVFAAERLEKICAEHGLDPETQAAEVARWWNERRRSSMDAWRLGVRMRFYLEMQGTAGRAA